MTAARRARLGACGGLLAYGAVQVIALFLAVRWGYPVAALCVIGLLTALWFGVTGRLLFVARRRGRRLWFRWERLVAVRILEFLFGASLVFVIVEILDRGRPDWGRLMNGVFLAVMLAMSSGQSWKDADRVREVLPEGERLKVAVPVRWGRAPLWRRAAQGRFLVFTDQRVLLFAYHRFLDIPVARPLCAWQAETCTARLNVAERRLVLTVAGARGEAAAGEPGFKVAAVRKKDLERYATRMARV